MTPSRRRWLSAASQSALACFMTAGRSAKAAASDMLTLYTFGDSVLDCGHYNPYGVHPGQLLVRNDDRLFPDFAGKDL